jgi:hypothetical protein
MATINETCARISDSFAGFGRGLSPTTAISGQGTTRTLCQTRADAHHVSNSQSSHNSHKKVSPEESILDNDQIRLFQRFHPRRHFVAILRPANLDVA